MCVSSKVCIRSVSLERVRSRVRRRRGRRGQETARRQSNDVLIDF